MRCAILLAVLSLVVFPLVSQALLWDFNDKGQEADWEVISGICEIDDNAYKVSDAGAEALTVAGESNWTDYTISGKARLTQPAGFNNVSIAFRASDDGASEYMFMLEGGRQQAEWWKKIGGGYTEIQTDPLEIELEDWFSFKVVVNGDNFDGYYEGELISSIEDGDLTEGKVGIRVYGCTAHVDDFDVNGIGIPATDVEAIGKLASTWGSLKKW
jgi:endoglucanase